MKWHKRQGKVFVGVISYDIGKISSNLEVRTTRALERAGWFYLFAETILYQNVYLDSFNDAQQENSNITLNL